MKKLEKIAVGLAGIMLLGYTGTTIFADEVDEPVVIEEIVEDTDLDNLNNAKSEKEPNITYFSHVSMIGDTEPVENGEVTGTEGKSLQMEALCIELDSGDYSGDIEYSAHVANVGWMDYVSSSHVAGTTGKGQQMEAVKIRLTDELADNYDVYYSAHIANYGWLGWADNDQFAGSAGHGLRMEAIKILLQKKGLEAPESNSEAFIANQLTYQAHVSNIGWMNNTGEGTVAGTAGQSKRMEALKIELDNAQYDGGIEYSVYVKGAGWQNYVSDNAVSGTVGQGKPLEAIKVRLTGEMANHYDIYYQVHSSNYGWQGWTCNDNEAGTLNYGEHLEAIQLQLISKYEAKPAVSNSSFIENNLNYQAHVSNVGWMKSVIDGQTAGTTGRGLGIEALKISLKNIGGDVLYKSYSSKKGWEPEWTSDNKITGTTGEACPLEAIQIKLSDDIASEYDIFYRVHVSGLGWLDWVTNGELTGTVNQRRNIEAIDISLHKFSTKNTNSTISYGENDVYYVQDQKADGWQKIYGYNYYFENGSMVTNRNVGGRLIGSDGKEISYPALEYARNVLNLVGWDLKAGYDWVINHFGYHRMEENPGLGSNWYAQYGFENGGGNCYVFAAAVYQMGLLLNYDIHQVYGNHITSAYGLVGHSWLEVTLDNNLYVIDPDFEKELGRNGFLLRYGAGGTLRYNWWSRMN